MEKPKYIFSDEYTGERWTYGLTYRPFMMATVPKGFIIGSLQEDGTPFRFGTIQYPFELTEQQVSSYELTLVEESDA